MSREKTTYQVYYVVNSGRWKGASQSIPCPTKAKALRIVGRLLKVPGRFVGIELTRFRVLKISIDELRPSLMKAAERN
jgi:hypothetical protein